MSVQNILTGDAVMYNFTIAKTDLMTIANHQQWLHQVRDHILPSIDKQNGSKWKVFFLPRGR